MNHQGNQSYTSLYHFKHTIQTDILQHTYVYHLYHMFYLPLDTSTHILLYSHQHTNHQGRSPHIFLYLDGYLRNSWMDRHLRMFVMLDPRRYRHYIEVTKHTVLLAHLHTNLQDMKPNTYSRNQSKMDCLGIRLRRCGWSYQQIEGQDTPIHTSE